MRFFLAGLITLFLATAAWAQATGDVEAVGFGGGYYRPGVWNPMLVRLRATTGASAKYTIEVDQEDLDKDHAYFSEARTLQGNPEGSTPVDQRFWVYFQPTPTPADKGGLPQPRGPDLNSALKVFLCTEDGKKQLQQLEITQSVQSIDTRTRGTKLVLFITGRSQPILMEFEAAAGMNEDLHPVRIGEQSLARSLPENVIGYDPVDAIVWLDADPQFLSSEQDTAIRQYVRRGGRLIVCQTGRPVLWSTIARHWADLLPVTVNEIGRTDKLEALQRIADTAYQRFRADDRSLPPRPFWSFDVGPFDLAHAQAKPGAYVTEADGPWPYIVNGAYGRGEVTWVAQDLGDATLTGNANEAEKWLFVWNTVFDWPSHPLPGIDEERPDVHPALWPYENRSGAIDLGFAEKDGMELPSTGAALVALAVLFFILYWVLAGPGSYLMLASKKKTGLSWFAFALVALVATAATGLIVHLVLRGPPELRHVSYVSMAPGVPALVRSEFGLYIPRDGLQRVELKDASADSPSYITAYPIHPDHLGSSEGYTAYETYVIPIDQATSIDMPYRRTLKKFETCWVGQLSGIEGTAQLVRDARQRISGTLVNRTGRTLNHVYLVFRYPKPVALAGPTTAATTQPTTLPVAEAESDDMVYYLGSSWAPDGSLNLDNAFGKLEGALPIVTDTLPEGRRNKWDKNIYGTIERPDKAISTYPTWNDYWYDSMYRSNLMTSEVEQLVDSDANRPPRAFVMLSLFDRLPTVTNKDRGSSTPWMRFDLLRRGKRQLDVSPAISAGQLVILAEAQGEIPVPLEVDGDKVKGEGITYYQFILPLDRSGLKPTTLPTTLPATRPAKQPATR